MDVCPLPGVCPLEVVPPAQKNSRVPDGCCGILSPSFSCLWLHSLSLAECDLPPRRYPPVPSCALGSRLS